MTTRSEQLETTSLHARLANFDASSDTDRPFEETVGQLIRDCAALGMERQVPLRVRVALRRRLHLQRWKRNALILLFLLPLLCSLSVGMALLQWRLGWIPRQGESAWSFDLTASNPWQQTVSILSLAVAIGLLLLGALEMYVNPRLSPRRATSRAARLLVARRYALVTQCAAAIHACAQARRSGEQRPARLRKLAKELKIVQRGVLDAHHSRGTVARWSHRTKTLKRHERHVAGALRVLESKLDHAPNEALRDIAEALLTISDRYCQTRIGELLDEDQLNDIEPQRNWDVLRLLTAYVVGAGGVTALALTGVLPESAEPYVYTLVLAAAFLIAFGRNVRRTIDVLSAITGGV
ncbi:hypothetical protein [Streptomyces sp. NBC_01546]|uniref:hypothetical protein n=1 Tax=Streptomyces sp. NBC_01546 TaxID=2975872 RepID=UPI002F90B68A